MPFRLIVLISGDMAVDTLAWVFTIDPAITSHLLSQSMISSIRSGSTIVEGCDDSGDSVVAGRLGQREDTVDLAVVELVVHGGAQADLGGEVRVDHAPRVKPAWAARPPLSRCPLLG